MKVIIAGSREGFISTDLWDFLDQGCGCWDGMNITEVVSGGARGVDSLGEMWASDNNIPVKKFPADWDLFGKSAGYKRNEEMAQYADCLVALWDGKSKGTKHMIELALKYNLKLYIYTKVI